MDSKWQISCPCCTIISMFGCQKVQFVLIFGRYTTTVFKKLFYIRHTSLCERGVKLFIQGVMLYPALQYGGRVRLTGVLETLLCHKGRPHFLLHAGTETRTVQEAAHTMISGKRHYCWALQKCFLSVIQLHHAGDRPILPNLSNSHQNYLNR